MRPGGRASAAPTSFTFQSTHPRGVRPKTNHRPGRGVQFQSTHPRGVRLMVEGYNIAFKLFQSTHPRGVRPTKVSPIAEIPSFQSTHPRGVRHYGQHVCNSTAIFQSTHPRGVRLQQHRASDHPVCHFNPRTHVGCDRCKGTTNFCNCISIHAPTWGATCCVSPSSSDRVFQSTHPRGVRLQRKRD